MSGQVRLGVIGLGNIGQAHIKLIQNQQVSRVALAAVSSRSTGEDFGVPHFTDYRDLLSSTLVDAVLVATPTMLHPQMAAQAGKQGLHLLMEKPLAMSVGQAQQMLDEFDPQQKFAVMLNQRFHPCYQKMKTVISSGAIGQITRVAWTMTAWYRPNVYYDVSAWRGTWAGEGGGLLINQCIHNLDVLQWLVGLPANVSAMVGFGKYHNIAVEDEFTAMLSYAGGATGVVVASSGEAPGINQLDIIGDRGMLRFDGKQLLLSRSATSVQEHCRSTDDMFGMPEFTHEALTLESEASASQQHARVLQNFVDSILDDVPLATSAADGLASLQLANGILLSGWTNAAVALPIDAQRFELMLQQQIAQSGLRTPMDRNVNVDMDSSYR